MPQSHSADLRPRSFRPDRARHLPQRREAPSASCECWTRERAIVFRGYSTIIFLVLVAWMHDLKSLREELLLSVARWQPEMTNSAPRSTLQYGIAQKCYTLLDRILAVCTAEAITLTGRSGEEACRSCGGGKPPWRMTLGERVQVLEKLDSELSKVLPQIRGTRALGKSGVRLLHSISKNRN